LKTRLLLRTGGEEKKVRGRGFSIFPIAIKKGRGGGGKLFDGGKEKGGGRNGRLAVYASKEQGRKRGDVRFSSTTEKTAAVGGRGEEHKGTSPITPLRLRRGGRRGGNTSGEPRRRGRGVHLKRGCLLFF